VRHIRRQTIIIRAANIFSTFIKLGERKMGETIGKRSKNEINSNGALIVVLIVAGGITISQTVWAVLLYLLVMWA